jgi:hypothetical protein
MPQDIEKYRVVRRGPKWCVRVKGRVNTTDSFGWCHDRNMSYHIKQHWPMYGAWYEHRQIEHWDYDFIFDKPTEATAFILGYL